MKGEMLMFSHFRKLHFDNTEIDVFEGDLFLPYFGGNKARKILSLTNTIVESKYSAIVTTGGIQSNHCRVVALFAAQLGMYCTLVLHGSKDEFQKGRGNALLMKMTGAELIFVDANHIGIAMDSVMLKYESEGYKPYYLYGGGHNKQGVEAYIELTKKLFSGNFSNKFPDHIFLASGTGSTQAGIMLGLKQLGLSDRVKVHGISVGREKQNGIKAIRHAISFIDDLYQESEVLFYDDFLFGGYGNGKESLIPYVNLVAKKTGLILDPIYTGKAFFGMMDRIKYQNLKGRILFWHTGGVFNLME